MHSKLIAAASLLALASAQTYTSCNPLEKSCPDDAGLGPKPLSLSSFSGKPDQFTVQSSDITYQNNEAQFVINKQGNAPTLISSFYFFFGTVSVVMKASSGTGIVSSIVLESDDLDEIDWEFLGGNTGQVETNYFGKGNTTTYDRATYVPVSSPQDQYHNYTLNWQKDQLEWIIDGSTVRTLKYSDANGGANYPQTPMRLRIGTWAGGDPSNPQGTIQWAGGQTDYTKAPFTANMKSLSVTDASQGSAYSYGDKTGSYQSIKVNKDSSAGASASAALSSAAATATSGSSSATPAAMPSGVAASNSTSSGNSTGSTGSSGGSNGTSTGSGGSSTTSSAAGSSSSATSAGSLFTRSGALGAAAAIVGVGMAML